MWWLTSGILLLSFLASCAPAGTAPAAPSPAPPPATPELQPISLEIGLPATTAFTWPFLVIRDGPIGVQERITLELPILDTDQRVTQATLSGSVDFGEAAFATLGDR